MVHDRTKDFCILSCAKGGRIESGLRQMQPSLKLGQLECSRWAAALVVFVCLALLSLHWRQDAVLREVAGVNVTSVSHLSALEESLKRQGRNLSAEVAALKEEFVLSSEWVDSIQRGAARDSENSTAEATQLRARLGALASRLSGLEAAVGGQGRSAAEAASRLEAGLASQRSAAEAALIQEAQRRQAADARSEAKEQWLAKQYRGVLAVEEALAAQIDKQRQAAEANASEAAAQAAGLQERLARQEAAATRLEEELRQQQEAAGAERAATAQRSLRLQRAEATAEKWEALGKEVARLEGELGRQRALDSDRAAALRSQDAEIAELRGQLRRQHDESSSLEADVGREHQRYLDLAAELATRNESSAVEAEQHWLQQNLSSLAQSVESQGKSIVSLEEGLGHEKKESQAREEAMAASLNARMEKRQKRLAKAESALSKRESALEVRLAHEQQDSEKRTRTLGDFFSKHTKEAAASEMSTEERMARLEMELSRQHNAEIGTLRGGALQPEFERAEPGGGADAPAAAARPGPSGADPQPELTAPAPGGGGGDYQVAGSEGSRLAGISALGGITAQQLRSQ